MRESYTDWREVPIPVPKGLESIPTKIKAPAESLKVVKRFDYSIFSYWFRLTTLSLMVLFGAPPIPVVSFLISFSLLGNLLIRLNQLILAD